MVEHPTRPGVVSGPPAVEVEIAAALDGERVDRVVAMLTGLSRAVAAALVDAGGVLLDGTVVPARSQRVATGQVLVVHDVPEPTIRLPEPDPSVPFGVVFEDEHLLVVDKPAGVVAHPGNGVGGGTLVHGLLARHPGLAGVGEPHRPGIVHRLDRGTSGLLVVALDEATRLDLIDLLATHDVHRRYRALVLGHPNSAGGLVDAPIGRSRRDPTRRAVTHDGKPARTRFRVVATHDGPEPLTQLDCDLETGRTHQIRVHLRSIGHPVVADTVYGGGRCTLGLDRPFLHARELAFTHPRTGEALSFESPLPEDLSAVLARLDPPG